MTSFCLSDGSHADRLQLTTISIASTPTIYNMYLTVLIFEKRYKDKHFLDKATNTSYFFTELFYDI